MGNIYITPMVVTLMIALPECAWISRMDQPNF